MRALFTGLVLVAAVAAALAVTAAYLSGGPPGGDLSARVVAPLPQAPLPDPLAAAAPPATAQPVTAPAEPASLAAAPTPTGEAAPARPLPKSPAVQRASADTTDLARRVGELMAAGDAAAARAELARVAEAGNATAALMLASTYDPNALRTLGVPAVRPDLRKARTWYEKAARLGSTEASRRLAALAAQR
jgi:TPR repeat protein